MDKKYDITDKNLLVFEFDQEGVVLEDKYDNVCIYGDKKINIVIYDYSRGILPEIKAIANHFLFIKNEKKMYIYIKEMIRTRIYFKNFPFMEGCFELIPKVTTKNLVTDKYFFEELVFIKGSHIKVSEKMQETVFEKYHSIKGFKEKEEKFKDIEFAIFDLNNKLIFNVEEAD